MENMMWIAVIAIAILWVIVVYVRSTIRQKKEFAITVTRSYGQVPTKKYTPDRFARISGFFEHHPQNDQIDDGTWDDLGMDDIFTRIDNTYSAVGEEYLYYLLRTPHFVQDELDDLEKLIRVFDQNPKKRLEMATLANRLGYHGSFSLYDYLGYLEKVGAKSLLGTKIRNICYMPAFAMLPFLPVWGLVAILALSGCSMIMHYRAKSEIEPFFMTLVYILRLQDCARRYQKTSLWQGEPASAPESETIPRDDRDCASALRELRGLRRGSFLIQVGVSTGGNPGEILMEYIRIMFHADILQFYRMARIVYDKRDQIDVLVRMFGRLEASLSIASFRRSLADGFCLPTFTDSPQMCIQDAYHPLITQPVKNNLRASGGILLTGSNASGKSTFLKTIALEILLAQTIHTCVAKTYTAPFMRLYSSMSLRDDLENGDSYYIAELKSLLRVFRAAAQEGPQVVCFLDEVLRGTNTVERIAASSQILRALVQEPYGVRCFAATHDRELTQLLTESYENYHFEERIEDGDIVFPYRLLPGSATTQNAIMLLGRMGYPDEVTQAASTLAKHYEHTKQWGEI
jgi:energy-coupling factor transporter ATP-binding protein EcfA2